METWSHLLKTSIWNIMNEKRFSESGVKLGTLRIWALDANYYTTGI